MQPSPNGNNPESSGLNLPPPIAESAGSAAPAENQNSVPEMAPAAPEKSTGNNVPASQPMPQIQLPQSIQNAQAPQKSVDSTTTQSSLPAIADDADLIEKEWVNKAKQIVERTKEDPHQQSKELTSFKADYLQKRYNKTIKVSE